MKPIKLATIPVLALAASAATFSPAASAATAGTPTVVLSGTIQLTKMGLYLDDRNNSRSNGAVVQVWQRTGGPNQVWQVMSDGTIRHNGLCLDAVGWGKTNGTKVDLWACTGGANQQWRIAGSRVTNPVSGKVLNDAGYGGNGTQQVLWTNVGSNNEIWGTTPTPPTVSITGTTSKQDQPKYTDPNNDFVTVADSAVFGTSTVATIKTLVDGVVVATVPSATYPAGTATPVLAQGDPQSRFRMSVAGGLLTGPGCLEVSGLLA